METAFYRLLLLVGLGVAVPALSAEITLLERDGFAGRSFTANQLISNLNITSMAVTNFSDVGFNDRAVSLRIEGGYWLFCSDVNFAAECLTFGRGDYPTIPHGFVYKISSAPRINSNYPYNQNPTWQR